MGLNRAIFFRIVTDTVLAFLAIPAAFIIRFGEIPPPRLFMDLGMLKVFLFIFVVVTVSFFMEAYQPRRGTENTMIAIRVLWSLMLSFAILSIVGYSASFFMFGRGMLAIALVVFGFLQFLCHVCYGFCNKLETFTKRVLILGTGPLAGAMGKIIPDTNGTYILSGYVSCSNEPIQVPAETVLQPRGELYETVRQEKADQIVVSLTERRGVLPLQQIMACKLSGIKVIDAPSFYEQMTGKLLLESINPSWFIFSEGFRITPLFRVVKRSVEVVISIAGIVVTLPLFPLVALAIKLDSEGPVLFRQVRVGEREKDFILYKFRTMRQDAENGSDAVWAQEDDPRVTRVGKFFRKCRIDELPQLFNVLVGNMSLVGPRPERPEFVAKLKKIIPYYSERHFVKPGITGWAQVCYPYGASVEEAMEKLRYDLYYIKNLSLTLDMKILLETTKVIVFGRGGR